MANLEIQNNKARSIQFWEPQFQTATAVFGGAATWPAGSVLGKITASGKYARFAPSASDGSEIPIAVLTQDLESAGAGDVKFNPLISGRVRFNDLLTNVDGAITDVHADQLRDFTIIAVKSQQLAELDNQ
mgnify:CR=1 FL=1